LPRNKERPRDTFVGSTLRGLGDLFTLLGEMLETCEKEVGRSGEVKNLGGAKGLHATYAYSVKTLTDDEPTYRSPTDLCRSACREPLLDVFEEGNSVKVLMELLGAEAEGVKVTATETELTISVEAPPLRHHREVQLPVHVKPETTVWKCANGVLEVKLEKADAEARLTKD